MDTKQISSAKAHKIAKPFLSHQLTEGDEWFAVTKTWYTQFQRFAYLDPHYAEIEEKDISSLPDVPPPPVMNNSSLRSAKRALALRRDLKENEHFVWICSELYSLLVQWFGVENGSLTFKREVVNLGNEWTAEFMIEMHPSLHVCCLLCGQDGEPDATTQCIVNVPRHYSVEELIAKITTASVWEPDLMSGKSDTYLFRIWERRGNEWILMTDRERSVPFEDWTVDQDMSFARYMVELMEPSDGVQLVKRSLPWRAVLCTGSAHRNFMHAFGAFLKMSRSLESL